MLKYVLLATAMTVAMPALARQVTPSTQSAPLQGVPVQDSMAQGSMAKPATPAQTTSQPAASRDQVTQIVDAEFPTYDKNTDGNLDQAEFASWMVTLKTASDPTTSATSAETRTWVGAAFAQADKDKSKSVTKTELTGFLSQGAS